MWLPRVPSWDILLALAWPTLLVLVAWRLNTSCGQALQDCRTAVGLVAPMAVTHFKKSPALQSLQKLRQANINHSMLIDGNQQECSLDDLSLRLQRLHTIFNAQPAEPFVCQNSHDSEAHLVCTELKRAAAINFTKPAQVNIIPLARVSDRLFGTQYLADVYVSLLQQKNALSLQARVVDDARYQLRIDLHDDNQNGLLVVIMALYNRGSQLSEWSKAMAAVPEIEKHRNRTRLCVADFSSSDVDVDLHLRATGFTYNLLQLPGKFAKTVGLNACLALVAQNTANKATPMIFTTDVDVTVPPNFTSRIRRFVRPGRQVYAPVVLYEKCTWTDGECWGEGGYGLVGFSLEDGVRADLYAEDLFNYREGFEDTDFLLRLLRLPLIVIRRKERDWIHRWHPRASWKDEQNEGPLAKTAIPRIC